MIVRNEECSSTRILNVILSYPFVLCIIFSICVTSLNYYFIHVDSYGYNSLFCVYTYRYNIVIIKELKPESFLLSFTKGKKKIQGKRSSKAEHKNNWINVKCTVFSAIVDWTYFIEYFIKGIGHKFSNLFRPLPIHDLTNSIFYITCIRRSWIN